MAMEASRREALRAALEAFDFDDTEARQDAVMAEIVRLSPTDEVVTLMFHSDRFFDAEAERFRIGELLDALDAYEPIRL